MLGQLSRLIVVVLVGCSMLSGCGYMTKSGRQQIAYAHYVKKYSHRHAKQKMKYKRVKMPAPPPSDAVVHASAGDSPQSVSSNEN